MRAEGGRYIEIVTGMGRERWGDVEKQYMDFMETVSSRSR